MGPITLPFQFSGSATLLDKDATLVKSILVVTCSANDIGSGYNIRNYSRIQFFELNPTVISVLNMNSTGF